MHVRRARAKVAHDGAESSDGGGGLDAQTESALEEYVKTVQGQTGLHATHKRTVHM